MVSQNREEKKSHSFWIQTQEKKMIFRFPISGHLCIQVLFLVTESRHLPRRLFYAKVFFWFWFTLPFHLLNPNLLHNLLCVDIWYTRRVTAWRLNVRICTFSSFTARMLVSLVKPTERTWAAAADVDPLDVRSNEWDLICLFNAGLIRLTKQTWFFQDQATMTTTTHFYVFIKRRCALNYVKLCNNKKK